MKPVNELLDTALAKFQGREVEFLAQFAEYTTRFGRQSPGYILWKENGYPNLYTNQELIKKFLVEEIKAHL